MEPDGLEENFNEAKCVGREFQWNRMTWKRIPMKPSVLEENSNGVECIGVVCNLEFCEAILKFKF